MKRKMSIKYKLYLFIILTILLIASITIIFSYITNSNQIDSYYKKITTDNANPNIKGNSLFLVFILSHPIL